MGKGDREDGVKRRNKLEQEQMETTMTFGTCQLAENHDMMIMMMILR